MAIIEELRARFSQDEFEFSKHAVDQTILREISIHEIRDVISIGEIIVNYLTETMTKAKDSIGRLMYISDLGWDDYRVEHIARHEVEPYEVWEICEDPLHLARRQGHNRYRLYGQTADGRYLFVVLERVEATVYKPITARDMTAKEKRNFRRLRK